MASIACSSSEDGFRVGEGMHGRIVPKARIYLVGREGENVGVER